MASGSTIRNLIVRLGVDADDRAAMNMDKAIQGVKKSMIAAALAAAGLAAGFAKIVRDTANAGDEAAKMAKELGTTAGAMQELEFAAAITGTSIAEMSTGMRRLGRSARDATQGSEKVQAAFRRLNVEVQDNQGNFRDNLDIFEDTLGALTRVESAVERAALAQDLLGRAGTKLLRIAERGGMTIGDLRDQAQSLGFVMSDEAAASSEEFNDAMAMMQFWLRGVRNQIGLAFMPQLTAAINRTREWLMANRAIIDEGIEKGIDLIRSSIEGVSAAASRIDEIVNEWTDWNTVLTTIGSTISGLGILKFIPMLIAGIKGIAAVVLALLGPLGLKIAAIIALGLLIQDLIVWFRGGESVIGSFIGSVEDAEGPITEFTDKIMDVVESVGDFLMPIITDLMDLFKSLGALMWTIGEIIVRANIWAYTEIAKIVMWLWTNVLQPIFSFFAPFVQEHLRTIVQFFTMTFDQIKDILDFFLAIADGEFDSFAEIARAALDLVVGLFVDQFNFIVERVGAIFGTIIEPMQPIFDWIKEQIDATIGRITGAIDKVKGLADGVKNIGGAAKGAIGKIPGVGRLVGGDGAADDAANNSRGRAVQNTAMAVSRGDMNLDVSIGGTNSSAEEISASIGDQIRRALERDRRQALAAFGGGDI